MDIVSNQLTIIIFASLFIGAMMALGGLIIRFSRLEIENPAFKAMLGLLVIILGAWFSRSTSYSANIAYGLTGFSIFLLIIGLSSKNSRKEILDLIHAAPTICVITIGYAYVAHGANIALLINNDLFQWYSVAAHFLGSGNFFNMAPPAEAIFSYLNFQVDGFGTNWFLILVGMGSSEIILSAQAAVIILVSLIALSVQSQLSEFLRINRNITAAFSLLVVFTPLFVYVAYNGFFAHLLGTFCGAMLIYAVLCIVNRQEMTWLQKYSLVFVPTCFLLLSYQSGFLVFQSVAIGLIMSVGLAKIIYKSGWDTLKILLKDMLFTYIPAVVSAMLLLHDIVGYMIRRTIQVADIEAGWAAPPWIPKLVSDYAGVLTPGAQVFVVYGTLGMCILACAYYLAVRFMDEGRKQFVIVSLSFFGVLLMVYLLWHLSGRSPYQNWKYASFFIYSISFAVVTPFAYYLDFIKYPCADQKKPSTASKLIFFTVLIGFVIWSVAYMLDFRRRMVVYDQYVKELTIIKEYLPPAKSLLLDLQPYAHSMLAMQMLSKKNQIFPLAKTYFPETSPESMSLSESYILKSKGGCDVLQVGRIIYESSLYVLGIPANGDEIFDEEIRYEFSNNCMPLWLRLRQGFAGVESWGRWSDGKTVIIEIHTPRSLKSGNARVEIDVQPYIPSEIGVLNQSVAVKVNDIGLYRTSLKSRETISFDIPSKIMDSKKLLIEISLPDAVSPASFGSRDNRVLGVSFFSIHIYPLQRD